jgi:hypothetical protein
MTANRSPLELTLGGSVLAAVPAVHFQVAFAEEVNRLCSDPARRPDAIAVELGPLTAAAIRQWLTELGIGPTGRKRLPVMLGLVRPHRYLRPSMRERALALQRNSGVALQDLPSEVLQRELDYSPKKTNMLSPTDSIIEAIRCGCELGVPVYGVDLEYGAKPYTDEALFQDPILARDRVPEYVGFNEPYVQVCDEEVDPRREIAMAARLKALLERHARVLFTCGMAHWRRVREHLYEASLRPALIDSEPPDASALEPFERVIIDPRIAAPYLDRFPIVARICERRRHHSLLGAGAAAPDMPSERSIHRRLLRKAYRRYFSNHRGAWSTMKPRDWSAAPAFEQLLDAQTCVNMHALPTLVDILSCARASMSREFCGVLGRTLAEYPWLKPGALGIDTRLEPAMRDVSGGDMVIQRGGRHDGERFLLEPMPGKGSTEGQAPGAQIDLPQSWREALRSETGIALSYSHHSWIPWDNLLNGLSWQAICRSGKRQYAGYPEEFAGQLLEGIDVKATLRAQARGEEKLLVRDSRLRRGYAPSDLTEGLPVVWLFDGDPHQAGSEFQCYYVSVGQTLPYARDPDLFRRQAREHGDHAVAIAAFGKDNRDDPILGASKLNVHRFDLRGVVLFMPLFPKNRQFARWYERTGFARTPLTGFAAWNQLRDSAMARIEHLLGAQPASLRWQDLLVCASIPYAGQSVTLVAPTGFKLAPVVHRFAARCGKSIRMTSLERFP